MRGLRVIANRNREHDDDVWTLFQINWFLCVFFCGSGSWGSLGNAFQENGPSESQGMVIETLEILEPPEWSQIQRWGQAAKPSPQNTSPVVTFLSTGDFNPQHGLYVICIYIYVSMIVIWFQRVGRHDDIDLHGAHLFGGELLQDDLYKGGARAEDEATDGADAWSHAGSPGRQHSGGMWGDRKDRN